MEQNSGMLFYAHSNVCGMNVKKILFSILISARLFCSERRKCTSILASAEKKYRVSQT